MKINGKSMRRDENSTHFDIIFALPITGIYIWGKRP